MKEQYKMKCDQVQEMYEKLFKEAQTFKRQIVGVDEIKKDRDERVAALRTEIDQLQGQLDKLTSEHAALKVHSKSINEEYIRLNDDLKSMQINLNMSNKLRETATENLQELQKQYKEVKEAFNERDELLKTYKRKYEEEQKKLTEIERKADTLEIEKKSLEKQNDI